MPAASATAGTAPIVSYLDSANEATQPLRTALADGSGLVAQLSPPGYTVLSYDMSADGSTELVGMARGTAIASPQDRSYALVYVHRGASGTSSRVLTNYWDAQPQVAVDGSRVYWVGDDALWTYDGTSINTLATTAISHSRQSELEAFSVSPDGTKVAVVYREDGVNLTATYSRVLVYDLSGATTLLDTSSSSEAYLEAPPTWIDDSSFVLGYETQAGVVNHVVSSQPGWSIDPTSVAATVAGLQGVYDLRRIGTEWIGWRDDAEGSQYALAATPADLADATWTDRTNGDDTGMYVPTTAVPATVTAPVNPATSDARLYLSASALAFGRRAVYDGYALYLHALPGETMAKDASWIERGTLQLSLDAGRTWRRLHPGAHPQHLVPLGLRR
jgi:hypothetical protein